MKKILIIILLFSCIFGQSYIRYDNKTGKAMKTEMTFKPLITVGRDNSTISSFVLSFRDGNKNKQINGLTIAFDPTLNAFVGWGTTIKNTKYIYHSFKFERVQKGQSKFKLTIVSGLKSKIIFIKKVDKDGLPITAQPYIRIEDGNELNVLHKKYANKNIKFTGVFFSLHASLGIAYFSVPLENSPMIDVKITDNLAKEFLKCRRGFFYDIEGTAKYPNSVFNDLLITPHSIRLHPGSN